MNPLKIVAETERLLLRVFTDDDFKAAQTFWGDAEVMAQSGGAAPTESLPKTLKAYQRCQDIHNLSVYAVVEKDTNCVIGATGFNITLSIERVELIYHFSKISWGNGFAKEAAAACLELAKKHPDVQWVFASADAANRSSLKILERIGLEYKRMQWFDDTQQEEPYYELHTN